MKVWWLTEEEDNRTLGTLTQRSSGDKEVGVPVDLCALVSVPEHFTLHYINNFTIYSSSLALICHLSSPPFLFSKDLKNLA